jgi:signal transduction histidine kinase
VERLTKADRACAIAAAAAHDLNDELTVILSSVSNSIQSIEPGHPARPLLLDVRNAAQRCAWMASSLLSFSARRGVRPTAAKAERLVEIDTIT